MINKSFNNGDGFFTVINNGVSRRVLAEYVPPAEKAAAVVFIPEVREMSPAQCRVIGEVPGDYAGGGQWVRTSPDGEWFPV